MKKESMIKAYRIQINQDIRTFAKGCGVHENLLGKYENGYCCPSIKNFCKIVNYLYVSELDFDSVDVVEFMFSLVEFYRKK